MEIKNAADRRAIAVLVFVIMALSWLGKINPKAGEVNLGSSLGLGADLLVVRPRLILTRGLVEQIMMAISGLPLIERVKWSRLAKYVPAETGAFGLTSGAVFGQNLCCEKSNRAFASGIYETSRRRRCLCGAAASPGVFGIHS